MSFTRIGSESFMAFQQARSNQKKVTGLTYPGQHCIRMNTSVNFGSALQMSSVAGQGCLRSYLPVSRSATWGLRPPYLALPLSSISNLLGTKLRKCYGIRQPVGLQCHPAGIRFRVKAEQTSKRYQIHQSWTCPIAGCPHTPKEIVAACIGNG